MFNVKQDKTLHTNFFNSTILTAVFKQVIHRLPWRRKNRDWLWYRCYIVICWFMQKYTYIYWINTDTMINDASRKEAGRKTQEDFFRKIFTSHFIARVWKGCWRVACERMLETERKLHILTPLLCPSRCVFLVLLDAQPEVLESTLSGLFRGPPRSGVAFPTTSGLWLSGILLATASGVSEVPRGRVWPSLPHLISNPLGVCWHCPGTQTQLS